MTTWKLAHTCNELGACQSRKPACAGCTAQPQSQLKEFNQFPFAPGVIDHGPKSLRPVNPAVTKWLVRWVCVMLVVVVVCATAGYLS